MAEPLYELLSPYIIHDSLHSVPIVDPIASRYLHRLSSLPLSSLTSTEPQSLAQSRHSLHLSLQALSTRSHQSIIISSHRLKTLSLSLPEMAEGTRRLRDALPGLDETTLHFSTTFNKNVDNKSLDRRRKAILLSRNIDRLSDILDLPGLLSSAISSSSAGSTMVPPSTGAPINANYGSALDLHVHIRRLHTLYPTSKLISSVSLQAEEAMRSMSTNLIAGLRTQGVKLAGAIRAIGWLRRVAPDLDEGVHSGGGDGGLGALFLVCRLANLISMLEALEPLRELADLETQKRPRPSGKNKEGHAELNSSGWRGGQQTERYLKRYIEIFREQSFAIISMYKSIFPSSSFGPGSSSKPEGHELGSGVSTKAFRIPTSAAPNDRLHRHDPLQPLPTPLSAFPLYLVQILTETLNKYLPNVQDRSSRESLLTQVLYCAGSLGRLGGDFSLIVASLNGTESREGKSDDRSTEGPTSEDNNQDAWVEVVKKHRILAGRLELLASGVGGHGSAPFPSGASTSI
ncbi:hypothetical protein FGG08_002833 [Glutinoglossum americanum]|uniref:Conserved oligomeric Golgi complex subunit 8 n=1 Tax=Glutinoglossum americanum TaxID=1670608 RepID=A0A9P8L460_9PEZI|nr:hypothetical protein FGG08_002833 [Glutinoglossum americanum]